VFSQDSWWRDVSRNLKGYEISLAHVSVFWKAGYIYYELLLWIARKSDNDLSLYYHFLEMVSGKSSTLLLFQTLPSHLQKNHLFHFGRPNSVNFLLKHAHEDVSNIFFLFCVCKQDWFCRFVKTLNVNAKSRRSMLLVSFGEASVRIRSTWVNANILAIKPLPNHNSRTA